MFIQCKKKKKKTQGKKDQANTTVCATNKLPTITINEQKDPKGVVNSFYTFICNIGKKLADKILDNENHSFLNYLSNLIS